MGIQGLDSEMRSIEGCVVDVSIKELVEKFGENVIVVDGFNFYGLYLYPKFDWICGGFRELVQEIRHFVESFERIGVKLVFFFVEGNLDEGSDHCGSESWIGRRAEFINYTQMLFAKISQRKYLQNIKRDRAYYHTPLNALPVVLFALRHIFNCEVHLVYSGDRNDAVAYYSINKNCLALLGQDNYYVFYHKIPRYLSIRMLDLSKMTTVQYIPEVLARHRNLEGHLYPLFIRDKSVTSDHKNILFKIEAKLDGYGSTQVARKKIEEYLSGKKLENVLDVEDINVEDISQTLIRTFLYLVLRYKLQFNYVDVSGPLKKWNLIMMRAQELYASGHMSRFIEDIVMHRRYFNDCILEDFTDLPPSSKLFQYLRENLYSILLSEKPKMNAMFDVNESDASKTSDRSDDTETSEAVMLSPGPADIWEKKLYGVIGQAYTTCILDWHMDQRGCPTKPELVSLTPMKHPGLLQLWSSHNITSDIREKKWQLFASCISDKLPWQLLRLLPPTLVVPTVVLYYLFQVVPSKFKKGLWTFLQAWEMEVFIAQAVMLPKIGDITLSRIKIEKLNTRVVNLIAFFVYGCHHVRLLIEACGHPVSEHDLCVFHYFDGKLFHSFYDRAEWRRNARNLCDKETYDIFDKMKHIINPDPPARS